MNEIFVAAFLDEIEKIAADMGTNPPTSEDYKAAVRQRKAGVTGDIRPKSHIVKDPRSLDGRLRLR